jgi:septal ring factor EnvC (AmiA/AmiB activator)
MKILSKTLIAVSLSLFAVVPAFASPHEHQSKQDNRIMVQLEHQQHRIQQGIKKHQLTRKEARVLKRQQGEIRWLARRFYKDGYLSKKERRVLNRELRKSSRQIKHLRHNDLERYVNLHQRYGYNDRSHRL